MTSNPTQSSDGGLTTSAEGSIVRSEGAVAGVSIILLQTLPSVLTVHPVAVAVTLAARIDPWGHLCLLLQVKGRTIYLQSSHAAQEPPQTTRGTWETRHMKRSVSSGGALKSAAAESFIAPCDQCGPIISLHSHYNRK